MQPVRQIFENAPNSVPIPEELRHRRVEMILWPLDEEAPKTEPLKSLLSSMPDVGNEEDFMRKSDFGRDVNVWDI